MMRRGGYSKSIGFITTFNNPSISKERQDTLLIVKHKNPAKINRFN